MSLGKCKDCDKVVNFLVRGVCRECGEKRNDAFRDVRQYFRTHHGAGATEAADATGVGIHMIMGWIAEGRLTVSQGISAEEINAARQEQERVAEIRKSFAEQAGAQAAQVAEEFQRRRNGMHGRTY